MKLYYYIGLLLILIIGVIIFLFYKRNFFTKYKYIRIVRYNKDMTVDVRYIKKEKLKDEPLLINPKHVFDFKGYKSIILTSEAQESINPLDFESKYNPKDFKSAIRSKVISETFESLKVEKFDRIMVLLLLNILQLIAIAYLLYMLMGAKS